MNFAAGGFVVGMDLYFMLMRGLVWGIGDTVNTNNLNARVEL